jgi:hypothetical protein
MKKISRSLGNIGAGLAFAVATGAVINFADHVTGNHYESLMENFASQVAAGYPENQTPYWVEKFEEQPTLPTTLPLVVVGGVIGARKWRKAKDKLDSGPSGMT